MKHFMKKALLMSVLGLSLGSVGQAVNNIDPDAPAPQDPILVARIQANNADAAQRAQQLMHADMTDHDKAQLAGEISMIHQDYRNEVCNLALGLFNAGRIGNERIAPLGGPHDHISPTIRRVIISRIGSIYAIENNQRREAGLRRVRLFMNNPGQDARDNPEVFSNRFKALCREILAPNGNNQNH